MPHSRERHIISLLQRKLKFAPVLALQGTRQTGKSFLAREILSGKIPHYYYASLDRLSVREFAIKNPETFLKQHSEFKTFAIDEAQKAPLLFDAIKYEVDQKRIPGRYFLLGSTEFSKLSLIRESLTGRMSRARLYPMNLAEVYALPPNPVKNLFCTLDSPRFTRQQFLTHLERGGMPGIFGVQSKSERESLIQDWLELTVSRDAIQFPKVKIEPDLCMKILQKVALLEAPEAGLIAKVLKVDLRKIKTHIHVLQSLFVLHELKPHSLGIGKPKFFLCDVVFAKILGADFERQLHTWLIQEQLSQRAYRDDRQSELSYYRTPKGSLIHLVVETPGKELSVVKVFSEEKISERDLEVLRAFKKKAPPEYKTHLYGLASDRQDRKKEGIQIVDWEAVG